jgi:hypothetical protein
VTNDQAWTCPACADGNECVYGDALAVNVLDFLDRYDLGETNASGFSILLRGELRDWHDCSAGRREIDDILDTAVYTNTTVDGLRILLRGRFAAPFRAGA